MQEELEKYKNYFKLYSSSYIKDNDDRYIAYFKSNPNMSAIDVITHINADLDHEFYTNTNTIEIPDSPLVLVNKYNQLPSNYIPKNLARLPVEYTSGEVNKDFSLQKPAYEAFVQMFEAASKEGIHIEADSIYRSYNYQYNIYWNKYDKNDTDEQHMVKADKSRARAGFSEHQTGLAIDISNGDMKTYLEESFEDTKAGKWLATNAYKYGFILRYPKCKENITGYNYEPWHFRYVGNKIATIIRKTGLTYDEFYARYIKPVFIKYPEATTLSGNEFYDKHLLSIFILMQ